MSDLYDFRSATDEQAIRNQLAALGLTHINPWHVITVNDHGNRLEDVTAIPDDRGRPTRRTQTATYEKAV